jgi:hypothetical protein
VAKDVNEWISIVLEKAPLLKGASLDADELAKLLGVDIESDAYRLALLRLKDGWSRLLEEAEVRAWLRAQSPLARYEAAGTLVNKVAAVDFEDGTPPPAAFLATLDPSEERVLTALMAERSMPEPLDRAKQTARGMHVRHLNQQIEVLMAEVSNPSLTSPERQKIQKQILDLKIRVADVQRPFEQA